jgi:hypothetical protein
MRLQWIHLSLKLRIAQHNSPPTPACDPSRNVPSAFGRAAALK